MKTSLEITTTARLPSRARAATKAAQTSKSAVARVSKAAAAEFADARPIKKSAHDAGPPLSTRAQWAERSRAIRAFSEELCEPLHAEDYVIQSMPDASPAKWHLAHTSWFFETFILKPGLPGYEESEGHNSYLFNSYYNAVGPMHCRARRGMISRPTLEETYRYRQQVDAAMMSFFEGATEDRWRELKPVVVLGLNHEQQHQELFLTDIKHMLAQNPLLPAYANDLCPPSAFSAVPPRWVSFPEGLYWIGHEDDETFGFDNEGPR